MRARDENQSRPNTTAALDGSTSSSPGKTIGLGLFLIVAVAIAYLPAWNGKPIWDDHAHLTNSWLSSLRGLVLIWTEPGATQQYYPLVHTVFWIEHALWGDTTLPYHLLNILLHGLSAFLLYRILRLLGIPGAWLGAALFALHPVQVDSVAWISELKNTLSGFFFFSAALVYLKFEETRSRNAYATAIVLFLAGLLCKTAIAPLPAVLLVILWWKRGNISWKRDLLPMLPIFVLGIGAGLFTAWVERKFVGAQGTAFNLSILDRCLIAGRDFWFYLFKLIWPQKLTFIYPRWEINARIWWQWLFPIAVVVMFAILWKLRTRTRAPLAAALIFAGLLFPALGFINVYPFLYSFVADHFQYLACAAPLALAGAGIALSLDAMDANKESVRRAIYALPLCVLGILSWQQARQYIDIETLWRTTIAKNPTSWMAFSNLGSYLLTRGNVDEAISDFHKALELRPDQSKDHNNLGRALEAKGRMAEAMGEFQTALRISPNDSDTETNIGAAFLENGDLDEAINHLLTAIQNQPRNAEAYINLGNAYLQKREIDSAIATYSATLQLPYDHAETQLSLANAFRQKGDLENAIVHFRLALELRPDYADAHNNLGNTFRQQGRIAEAIREYEAALSSQPRSTIIENNLAWLLATAANPALRNGARAVQLAEQAVRDTGGGDPVMLHTLAAAYAENGDFDQAMSAANAALAIANANGITSLADSLRSKIALYQAHSAFHEDSAPRQ
jgi:tetratricopeptide (TPR) repeat protein